MVYIWPRTLRGPSVVGRCHARGSYSYRPKGLARLVDDSRAPSSSSCQSVGNRRIPRTLHILDVAFPGVTVPRTLILAMLTERTRECHVSVSSRS